MKKFFKNKVVAMAMAVMMLFSFSTVAFAAETDTAVETTVASESIEPRATTYLSASGSALVSTDILSLNKNMGWGTYTVNYNVSEPTNLYLWTDAYTSVLVATLNGSGSTKVSVPLFRTYRSWQLWCVDNSGTFTYSISITK